METIEFLDNTLLYALFFFPGLILALPSLPLRECGNSPDDERSRHRDRDVCYIYGVAFELSVLRAVGFLVVVVIVVRPALLTWWRAHRILWSE